MYYFGVRGAVFERIRICHLVGVAPKHCIDAVPGVALKRCDDNPLSNFKASASVAERSQLESFLKLGEFARVLSQNILEASE